MKLWLLSDLHLDVNRRHSLVLPDPRPEHDAVIIAGDICQEIGAGVRFIVEAGLNCKPVIYVAGNHEYYTRERDAELAAGRAVAAATPNVHLLECDSVRLGGVEVLGCTLWTDYLYAGAERRAEAMRYAGQRLNDHRTITNGPSRWSPQDALDEHMGSRAWLARQLKRRGRHRRVVVTHHAPSRMSVQPQYKEDLLTAAFASDLDALLAKATLWVHGHLHAPSDYVLHGCRVVANPRGYMGVREDKAFNPALVVEV